MRPKGQAAVVPTDCKIVWVLQLHQQTEFCVLCTYFFYSAVYDSIRNFSYVSLVVDNIMYECRDCFGRK